MAITHGLRRPAGSTVRMAAAVLFGVSITGGIVTSGAAPAGAAVTVNLPSGNDATLFNITSTEGCPTGSEEPVVAAVGPGSDFLINGEGVVSPGYVGPFTTANQTVANLRTATATFGVGPFPVDYAINLYCFVPVDGVVTPVPTQLATLTLTGIGQTGTTWTLVPAGGVAPTTSATVPTTRASATTNTTAPSASTTSTSRATTTGTSTTTGTTGGTTASAATTSTTTRPVTTTTRPGALANTGSDQTGFWLAGALIAGGVVLVHVARRRSGMAGTHRG